MKKYILVIILGILFTSFIGIALAENVKTYNADAFQKALEKDEFTVQKGELAYFDLLKLYEEGLLPCAYGNNPSTKYVIMSVPPAEGYKVDPQISNITKSLGMSGNTTPFWNLRPDEAIVFVGRTPPDCRYFSYDIDLMHRTVGNERRWIFANVGDTINNQIVKTEGSKKGSSGNPFDQTTVIIITADKGIDKRIRDTVQAAGYSDSITNTQMLPSSILHMGLENDSDTFIAAIRPALFADTQAGENYINNTPAAVFRITPNKTTKLDPYDYPGLRVRGTGQTELNLNSDLEKLKTAILKKYSTMKATDLPVSQGFPEGNDAIQRGINAIGPNNDACYIWTENQTVSAPTPPFFDPSKYYPFMKDNKITLGNNEFIIVYGVNHVATGKATYSSFAVYGEKGWNGLKAITDRDFSGSAEEYLPDDPNAKYLYVYKIARNRSDCDQYCYEVPYDNGVNGIALNDPLFIIWRAYLEKVTKTGPAYSEIVYDQAIKFEPKT